MTRPTIVMRNPETQAPREEREHPDFPMRYSRTTNVLYRLVEREGGDWLLQYGQYTRAGDFAVIDGWRLSSSSWPSDRVVEWAEGMLPPETRKALTWEQVQGLVTALAHISDAYEIDPTNIELGAQYHALKAHVQDRSHFDVAFMLGLVGTRPAPLNI